MPPNDPEILRIKAELDRIIDTVRPARLGLILQTRSAADLAAELDISPSSISRMRAPIGSKGRKRIGEETAFVIERKLGLPRGWLDEEIHPIQPRTAELGLSPEAIEVARDWEHLDDDEKIHFAELIARRRRERPLPPTVAKERRPATR